MRVTIKHFYFLIQDLITKNKISFANIEVKSTIFYSHLRDSIVERVFLNEMVSI